MFPKHLADRLKAAAETPVVNGDEMPRRRAIDQAIAWCHQNYPQFFKGDSYEKPLRPEIRRFTSKGKADKPGG